MANPTLRLSTALRRARPYAQRIAQRIDQRIDQRFAQRFAQPSPQPVAQPFFQLAPQPSPQPSDRTSAHVARQGSGHTFPADTTRHARAAGVRHLIGAWALVMLAGCAAPGGQQAPAASVSAQDPAGTTRVRPAYPGGADHQALPQSILWVGNSFFYYNNSLHNHFGRLVASGGEPSRVRSTSVTISGAGLDWHDMRSLMRPDGIGRYSFIANNRIRFNPPGRTYDTVIMMDCSQCPVHPQLQPVFHETVASHVAVLKASGVRSVLFMSWAYKDQPEMIAGLAENYLKAGRDHGAEVIPAGLAFARVREQHPEIELYEPDLRHPSLAGTYLAACTTYASLMRKSPVGLSYHAGLAPGVAEKLQQAALATVLAQRAGQEDGPGNRLR